MRPTSCFRTESSWCSIGSDLSKHFDSFCIVLPRYLSHKSLFVDLNNTIVKLCICRARKKLKAMNKRVENLGVKTEWMWAIKEKDVLWTAGEAAEIVLGETERQLPPSKPVFSQLTFGFFRKWILWSCWSAVMSMTCIKTSSSQNICCGQWEDSSWL